MHMHVSTHTNMLGEQLTYNAALISQLSLSLVVTFFLSVLTRRRRQLWEHSPHTDTHTHTVYLSSSSERSPMTHWASVSVSVTSYPTQCAPTRLDSTLNSTRLSRAYWAARRFSPFANVVSVVCFVLVVVGRLALSHSDDLPLHCDCDSQLL